MSEHAVQPKPRGGRPRVQQPLSGVSTRVPVAVHDRLIEIAKRREVSVAAALRDLIVLRLK